MKNLQIGQGWLDATAAAPVFQRLGRGRRQFDFDHGDQEMQPPQIRVISSSKDNSELAKAHGHFELISLPSAGTEPRPFYDYVTVATENRLSKCSGSPQGFADGCQSSILFPSRS